MLTTLKDHSYLKIGVAVFIVITALTAILYNPRGQEYFEEVEQELAVARKVCENSVNWVNTHREQLRLSKNSLKHIKVNGRTVEFEHIKHPKIIFFHTGYKHKGAHNELYCTFADPRRSSAKFFFDYSTESWLDKTMTRR